MRAVWLCWGLSCLLTVASAQDPETTTTSDDAFAQLRDVLADAVARGDVPGGALLVMHRGEVVFREGFGWDVLGETPFPVDAPCHIASLTKPVSASLLVLLEAEGLLDLDAPIDTYLPETRALVAEGQRTPLLRELLSHTSGLPGNQRRNEVMRKLEDPRNATLDDVVQAILATGLEAAPGTRYAYSRLGFDLAARAAELVSGLEYEQLMRERLFEPLGMTNSKFRLEPADIARTPTRYLRRGEQLQPDPRAEQLIPAGGYVNSAGGLVSTVDDLARFLQWHLDGGVAAGVRLIEAQALAQTAEPQPATRGYGLGFSLTRERGEVVAKSHGGASGTWGYVDLREEIALVLLTQLPTQQNRNFRDKVLASVREILLGEAPPTGPDAEALLERLDHDGDGSLSREECPQRLRSRFDRIDQDADGSLSLAELQRAAELVQRQRAAD